MLKTRKGARDDCGSGLCGSKSGFGVAILSSTRITPLVVKVPTRDRRQRVVRLTQDGEALFTSIWEVSQQKYAAIEDAFGRAEMRDLVVSLNRLRACLEPDEAPG